MRRFLLSTFVCRQGVIIRKTPVIVVSVILALAGLLLFLWLLRDPLYSSARRAWKNEAIARINDRLADQQGIDKAVATHARGPASRPSSGWGRDPVIVMRNGDWIVSESICSKQDRRIRDIFIGRGSDGRWYYSTFHFCINRVVLDMETQSDTLAQFVQAYWLSEFDGQSDECLRATWTGGPWGEEMISRDVSSSTP